MEKVWNLEKQQLPQQVGEASKGLGSDGGDPVVVDVELLQTGQVGQTKVLQLLNVVLLQVKSHQAAQGGQAHGANLSRERRSPGHRVSGWFVVGAWGSPEHLCKVIL